MPRLSIIIVSFNTRVDLQRCLESVARTAAGLDHEVVVVDNGSTDGSPESVRARHGVSLIEAGANLGFARANNLGIRRTSGDAILLLNSDTVVLPDALHTLVSRLEARPDVAVVGPRLVDGAGRAELSFGRMGGPFRDAIQKVLVRGHARGIPPISRWVERDTRREHLVDWVSGACLLVRRQDADAVGLLDERYFMYLEDVDFCAAIRARGRRVLFTPNAEVVHLRGRSATSTTTWAHRRSQVAFYQKHHPRWAPLLRFYLRVRHRWPAESA